MTFDRVLPELLRVCHASAAFVDVERLCAVRDVRGKVRLVVAPRANTSPDLPRLENELAAALGTYYVRPVISAESGGDVQRLAKGLLDKSRGVWPSGWPRSFTNVLGGADTPIDAGRQWTGIERTIGKEAWLTTRPPSPPWEVGPTAAPPIVTFHSFKGGSGRTTLVAAYAILAASGPDRRRVAIVDLDLEAPGVGSLFGVRVARGTLDVLVDHLATGNIDLQDASGSVAVVPDRPDVTVFPAGNVNDLYIQKLARLEFSSTEPDEENPVGQSLRAMLQQMRRHYDLILLDSRAGLHDLAGMSLHGLAHVDVLVFRGTEQNLVGLDQTLRTLGSRQRTELVLVETMMPATDDELFESRRARTREKVYEFLIEHVYPEVDPPQLVDAGDPHDVVSVRRKEWLDGIDSIGEHASQLFNDPELVVMAKRVDEAWATEIVEDTAATQGEER